MYLLAYFDTHDFLPTSHPRVIWPAAAFWCNPHDILRGVFDIAGFAVHAVLCVDLQSI